MSSNYQKIEGSAELVSSTQDLFAHAPTHTHTLEGGWTEIIPTTFSTDGEIQIEVPASSVNCYNLSDSYLEIRTKVVQDDDVALAATKNNVTVCPNDAFVHSLFKRIDMYINENLVESETNYPYRAYIEDLVNYSKGVKKSKLKVISGWYEDSALAKDGTDYSVEEFEARASDITSSKVRTYCTRLHLDMFNQQKPILPRNSIRLFFERANSKFTLMARGDAPEGGGKVLITKCSLFLRTAALNPALNAAINKALLAGNPATYGISKAETSFFTIAAGTSNEDRVIKSNGQLPTKVIIALVKQVAVNGVYKLNPFRFKDFGLSSIELNADGKLVERFEPNFDDDNYGREYYQALAINGKEVEDCETLTYEEFKEGRSIFAFDLTKDREDGPHLISTGSLNVKMVFKTPLPDTISFLVYALKDDEILIDLSQRISRTGDRVGR